MKQVKNTTILASPAKAGIHAGRAE